MKEKHLNTILATALLCGDAVYLYTAFTARKYKGAVIGPFDFSKYLGIALAILCTIIIIQSLRDKNRNEKVVIHNFDLVIVAVALSALLLIVWQLTEIFYPWGFVYIFALCVVLNLRCEKLNKRTILFCGILAGFVMAVIYLLFNVLMGLKL